MWKLIIEDDEGKRTVVPLTRDDYTLGRKEGNTIRLTERNVSREHAKIAKRADSSGVNTFVVEDLTSYNGVYINGLRVAHSQELVHGDLIQIGDYRLILQDDSVADVPAATLAAQDAKSTIPSGAIARASMLLERPNRLVMLAGPTPGAEYPLDQDRMTIGRAEDANISVNHNSVSRLHCEVHALGDGRFEIVDKGSSNGVRVNAAELRRGIIEAGDVIELGDVKFKFVGAGQIFRPGASESQQLSAISERAATSIVGSRRSSTALPVIVFLLVVGTGVAAAYVFARPRLEPSAASTVTPTPSPEQLALDQAKKLCDNGDCDAAHEKITAEIPENSPLRQSAEYREIEMKWADGVLALAESEADPTNKRNMLVRIARTTTVDGSRRKEANDRLEKLTTPTATTPNQLLPVREPNPTPREPVTHEPTPRKTPPNRPPPETSSSMPATPSAKPPASSDFDRQAKMVLEGGEAKAAARKSLEARVYGGKGSPDDVRMLSALCKEAGDKACVEQCRKLLSQ